jgi:hypothetical protein
VDTFLFTLTVREIVWDVYKISREGQVCTLAFARPEKEGQWIIGLLEKGVLSPDEVRKKLTLSMDD